MNRAARALLLVAVALLLPACASLVKLAYANAALAYSNLGSMVAWTVEDYVDLHTLQEGMVRGRIERLMRWHRAEELPRYRRFLESALARAEQPFTADDVAAHYAELRAHYLRLASRVLPDVADVLADLDPDQVDRLERRFARDNRELLRTSVRGTPLERRERRMKRFIGHLEGWIGPLDERQRELVDAYYEGAPDFTEEMLAERRYRQSEILALARARAPREAMTAALRRLFIETDAWRRPEYREKMRARDRRMFQLVAALGATLDDRQRRALRKRVHGLVQDIASFTAAS